MERNGAGKGTGEGFKLVIAQIFRESVNPEATDFIHNRDSNPALPTLTAAPELESTNTKYPKATTLFLTEGS